MTTIEKATEIMLVAHKNQKRKTDDSLYVIHPLMVALKLSQNNFSEAVIAAAMVHDVLEDTDFPPQELKKELGKEVFAIVEAVTEDKNLLWERRKQKYIDIVENSNINTKTVSIADKIHNLESLIATHKIIGKKIWSKFNRDKDKKMWFEKELLKVFKKTWDHPLVKEYENLIKQAEKLD